MKREISVFEDYAAMSRAAADEMLATVRTDPQAAMVIATGHSPLLAYRYFVEDVRREGIDLSRVTFIKLDEWAGLAPDDPATCEYFIRQELLTPLGIADAQYLAFDNASDDSESACAQVRERYDALQKVDLVILGIGMNGHLGLNEPGPLLSATAHAVPLDSKTRTHAMLRATDHPVTHGITLGMADLFRGQRILLLADGQDKADGLKAYLDDGITTAIPVSLLKLHPHCRLLINRSSFPDMIF